MCLDELIFIYQTGKKLVLSREEAKLNSMMPINKIMGTFMKTWMRLSLLHMTHTLTKKFDDVLVLNAIVHFLAVPPGNHQTHLAKTAQVVGDG